MHAVCPSCTTEYEIPDERMRPGRMVRCGRCATRWSPVPAEAVDLDLDAAQPSPPAGPPRGLGRAVVADEAAEASALERLALAVPPPPNPWPLRAAWGGSVAALVVLVGCAFAWRDGVMQVWPSSQRLYAAVGLRPAAEPAPHPVK